jgi:hypothetical protein
MCHPRSPVSKNSVALYPICLQRTCPRQALYQIAIGLTGWVVGGGALPRYAVSRQNLRGEGSGEASPLLNNHFLAAQGDAAKSDSVKYLHQFGTYSQQGIDIFNSA